MKAYYEKDGIVIYHGDCREIVPSLDASAIAAVVSDPPYGCGWNGSQGKKPGLYKGTGKSNGRDRWTGKINGDDVPFDPSMFLQFPVIAFTGAQYFYDRLPANGSLHCWNKRGDYKPMDWGDSDVIWCSLPKASRVFNLVWRGLCRHAEHDQKFWHPTLKPIELMKWIIGLCGDPPAILDPYMGSGTTLVAAKQLGLKATGIELEEAYCEIAVRRLRQSVLFT